MISESRIRESSVTQQSPNQSVINRQCDWHRRIDDSYQSNFTPNFAIRGPRTVVAFSKPAPERQSMFTAVFELVALNRSKNNPSFARSAAKRSYFSTRKSITVTFSCRRVPIGSARMICVP